MESTTIFTDKLLAAAAWSVFVFLRAIQQSNVAFKNYRLVVPVSWAMALCEVAGLTAIVAVGFSWDFVFILGTATGCATLTAMWLHTRYLSNGH